MKQQKCERCGTTKQLVGYAPIEDENTGEILEGSGIIACKVCNKKLSKMLKGLHWAVKDVEESRNNKDYEERVKNIVAVWKGIPLSKKEKEEISVLM
jgi:hypothetical protein